MCSISGVSFAPNSTIDRRKLANALLRAGEVRGRDASGYAWTTKDDRGFYKKDLPGGMLTTSKIPQNATSMILHTRAATHGHQRVMENNHPVMSPSGEIMLVHNGVIYNHDEVRLALGEDGKRLPEVDTSVIPAVIEALGLASTDLLEGDAACAWLDASTDGVIHLARFSHSPVSFTTLEDGTFVFASTESILGQALTRMGLRWFGAFPDTFDSMDNGEYLQILDGEIINEAEVGWGEFDYSGYSSWRSITSGATTRSSYTARAWEEDPEDLPRDTGRPAVLSGPMTGNYEDYQPVFWVQANGDNARQEFTNIGTMASCLRWYSEMSGGYDLVDDEDPKELRWINQVEDIGEIHLDTGEYISWLGKPNEMEDYGASVPSFIKDGVYALRKYEVRS